MREGCPLLVDKLFTGFTGYYFCHMYRDSDITQANHIIRECFRECKCESNLSTEFGIAAAEKCARITTW